VDDSPFSSGFWVGIVIKVPREECGIFGGEKRRKEGCEEVWLKVALVACL
jgi:hypothetical protein